MDTEIKPEQRRAFIATNVSLRPDQRQWLDDEAARQLHGNRSRIIQDALDLYRNIMESRSRTSRDLVESR